MVGHACQLVATIRLSGIYRPVNRVDDCWVHDRSKAVSDVMSPHSCGNVPAKGKDTIDRNAMSHQREKPGVYPCVDVENDALPYL